MQSGDSVPTAAITYNSASIGDAGGRAAGDALSSQEAAPQEQMRRIRHLTIREQVNQLNSTLRGHCAYYGVGANIRSKGASCEQ